MLTRALLILLVAFSFAETAASATSSWVYYNGNYSWAGDFSYGATADYFDSSGGPLNGAYDIKISVSGKWGAWQPYSQNFDFSSGAYTNFTITLKPTQANQSWQLYFTKPGNVAAGKTVNLASYGKAPVVGVWNTYTVPLADLGIQGAMVGSFAVQDTSGLSGNTWYVDNVGFGSTATTTVTTSTSTPAVSTSISTSIPAAVGVTTSNCVSSTVSDCPALSSLSPATVFSNGDFNWPGSFSYGVTLDYTDTSGAPPSGNYDLKVVVDAAWGAWQPYALNYSFNSNGYTKLTFSLKPTQANQIWQVYFMKKGDVPAGAAINVADYGPAPVVGKWATYSIPLSNVGVLGTDVYKFAIHDETGRSSNTWYVDSVVFQ